jgi:hypothetical protein
MDVLPGVGGFSVDSIASWRDFNIKKCASLFLDNIS